MTHIAGAFPEVLDSSIMSSFKSCPTLFNYQHIQHFKPKGGPNIHLHSGAAFAHGLERGRRAFFEEGKSADDSEAEALDALVKFWGPYEAPDDAAKSLDRMMGALEFYFTNYPLSEEEYPPIRTANGKRGIEFNFAEPIDILHPVTGNPIIYCGRMDAILHLPRDSSGAAYIVDEKTTSSLGATWSRQWDLRSQFTGYAWGCARAGIRVDGVIVRGVSILKTKYETQQAVCGRPEWQVDRWYKELLWWVEDMITCWKTGRWRHNLDSSCSEYGGCSFKTPCSSEEPASWLDTYFDRRAWNPLTRTEDPVEVPSESSAEGEQ